MSGSMRSASLKRFVKFAIAITRGSDDLLLVEVLLQVFQRRVADRRRATSDAVVSARICSSVTPIRFDEAVCARVQYSHPVHDCHERLLPVGLPS